MSDETGIAVKDNEIETLKKQVQDLQKELASKGQAEEPEKIEVDPKLLALACEAYGIDAEYVLDSGMSEDGAVVIVTAGGARVRWHKGDKPEPLSRVEITGVSERPRKPPVAGKSKGKGK